MKTISLFWRTWSVPQDLGNESSLIKRLVIIRPAIFLMLILIFATSFQTVYAEGDDEISPPTSGETGTQTPEDDLPVQLNIDSTETTVEVMDDLQTEGAAQTETCTPETEGGECDTYIDGDPTSTEYPVTDPGLAGATEEDANVINGSEELQTETATLAESTPVVEESSCENVEAVAVDSDSPQDITTTLLDDCFEDGGTDLGGSLDGETETAEGYLDNIETGSSEMPDPQFCPAGSSPGDPLCGGVHSAISDALIDATEAGTIYIEPGMYNEQVLISNIDYDLTLSGSEDAEGNTAHLLQDIHIENSTGKITLQHLFLESFIHLLNSQNVFIIGTTDNDIFNVMVSGIDPVGLTVEGSDGEDALVITADETDNDLTLSSKNTETISIEMGDGNDGIELSQISPGVNAPASININGEEGEDQVIFSADVSTLGGELTVLSEAIQVNSSVTLSTRNIAGTDAINDTSSGNSGGIAFTGKTISIGENARLLTHVDLGSSWTAGDISLIAEDLYEFPLVQIGETSRSATITLSASVIMKGNNILLKAEAKDEFGYDPAIWENFTIEVLKKWLLDNFSLPAAAMIKDVSASIDIGSNVNIEGSGNITIRSDAVADATVSAISGGLNPISGIPVLNIFSVAYSEANASAATGLGLGTVIHSTEGDVLILSFAKAVASATARTSQNLGVYPTNRDNIAISIAIAYSDCQSHTTLADSVELRAQNINVHALGESVNLASAETGTYENGLVGLTFALGSSDASITSEVLGRLTASSPTGDISILAQLDSQETSSAISGMRGDPLIKDALLKGEVSTILPWLLGRIWNDETVNKIRQEAGEIKPYGTHQFSIAAATAVSLAGHEVLATVGSSAVLKSERDILIQALLTDKVQLAAECVITLSDPDVPESRPDDAYSAAVLVGKYRNTARALVDGGAALDAKKNTKVYAQIIYPFLTEPEELYSDDDFTSPTAIGTLLDQKLGIQSKLFNSWARSVGQGGNYGFALSVNFLDFNNLAEAVIGSGTLINQTEAMRTDEQAISVKAEIIMRLVNMAGVFDIDITPDHLAELQTKDETLWIRLIPFNITGAEGEVGVGGSAFFMFLDNTIKAIIEENAQIHVGKNGCLILQSLEDIIGITLAQSGGSAKKFGFSGTFALVFHESDTLAHMQSGVKFTGGDINIGADDKTNYVTLVGGVMKGESRGVGASFGVHKITRKAQAVIGNLEESFPGDLGTLIGTEWENDREISLHARTRGLLLVFSLAAAQLRQSDPANPEEPEDLGEAQDPLEGIELPGVVDEMAPPDSDFKTGIAVAGDVSISIITDKALAYINDYGYFYGSILFISSNNESTIGSLAGAVAISKSGVERTKAIAGSFSSNVLISESKAFINGAYIDVEHLNVHAAHRGLIRSLTAGASSAPGSTNPQSTSVAGSVSVNLIFSTIEAYIINSTIILAGTSTVAAGDRSEIFAVAGALAYGGKNGFGISLALNMIGSSDKPALTTAYIKDSYVFVNDGILNIHATNGTSSESPSILAISGSLGIANEEQSISGAGMIAVNIIKKVTNAYAENSTIVEEYTSPDLPLSVELLAWDNSWILSIGGAVGKAKNIGLGAALAYNEITSQASTYLNGSMLDIRGTLSLRSQAYAEIEGATLGVAMATTKSGKAGAGSVTINQVKNTLLASLGGFSYITAAQASLEAVDNTLIVSITGGVAFAGKAAIGAAVSYNLVQNELHAIIDHSFLDLQSGPLLLKSASSPRLITIAVGGAGAKDFALGGSVAVNAIANTLDTHITNNSLVYSSADVTLISIESASMLAITGGIAVATDGAAIGAAVSYNYLGGSFDPYHPNVIDPNDTVTNKTSVYVYNSTISTLGDIHLLGGLEQSLTQLNPIEVDIGVTSVPLPVDPQSHILAVTIGGAGAEDFSLGGSVSFNYIRNSSEVELMNSRAYAAGLELSVGDHSKIKAVAGALAITFSNEGKTLSVGISVAINNIANTLRAIIDSSEVYVGKLDLLAQSTAEIDALTFAGSGSGSISQGSGLAVSGAGAVSINTINNIIEVLIFDISKIGDEETLSNIPITLKAVDQSKIKADAGGAALALSVGKTSSIGISVGAAAAINEIKNKVRSVIEDSIINTLGFVDVETGSQATIDVLTLGLALAISASGQGWGLSFAGAGSGSGNEIANKVEATIKNSTLNIGSLNLSAEDKSTIIADAGGGALAVSAGSGGTGSLAVGLAVAINDIGNQVNALVDNSSVTASQTLTMSAKTNGTIETFTLGGAASIAATSGSTAVSGAAAGAVSTNDIHNTVKSLIRNSFQEEGYKISAVGDISLLAEDESLITSDAVAGALSISVSSSASLAVSLGVTIAENKIANQIYSGLEQATVQTTSGQLLVRSLSNSEIDSLCVVVSVSVSVSPQASLAFSGGGTEAKNIVDNILEAFISNSRVNVYDSLQVLADETSLMDSEVYAISASAAFVSAATAVSVTMNTLDSSISAYACSPVISTTTGDISIKAHFNSTSNAETVVIAASFMAAGAGTETTVNTRPIVEAYLSGTGNIFSGNDFLLEANGSAKSDVQGTGIAAAVGVAASGAVIEVNLTPALATYISSPGMTLQAKNITLVTRYNFNEDDAPIMDNQAYGEVTLGSGALIAGVAGGKVSVSNSPIINTNIYEGVELIAEEDLALRSLSYQKAESNGLSVGIGGIVGSGTVLTYANAEGTIFTFTYGNILSARNVWIESEVHAVADAYGRAVGGSLGIAIAGPKVHARSAPQVDTIIAGTGKVHALQDVTVRSVVFTDADAVGSAFSVAILGAAGIVDIVATLDPLINTTIYSGAEVYSAQGNILVLTLHNYLLDPEPHPLLDQCAVASIETQIYALGVSVGDTYISARAAAIVTTAVYEGVSLTAPNGDIAIKVFSSNLADACVKSISGAAISISTVNGNAQSNGHSYIFFAGGIYTLNGSQKEPGAVNVILLNEGYDVASSTLDQESYGVVTISVLNSKAKALPYRNIQIMSGADIHALGNIEITTHAFTDGDAYISSTAIGAVNISAFYPYVFIEPSVYLGIGDNAVLKAGENVAVLVLHETCDLMGGNNPQSMASVGSSSSGFVTVGDLKTNAISAPSVVINIFAAAISGNDISILAKSHSSAAASTKASGSNFFSFTVAEARVNSDFSDPQARYASIVQVQIYQGATIQAEHDVLIEARPDDVFEADGTHISFDYMNIAVSLADINLYFITEVNVAGGAQIRAGNQIAIYANTVQSADVFTLVITTDDSVAVSSINIGWYRAASTVRIGADSQERTTLQAKTIDIQATSDIFAHAGATAWCIDTGFLSDGGTSARALIYAHNLSDTISNTRISLENSELSGETVNLMAKNIFKPETVTDSWCFVPLGSCNEQAIETTQFDLSTFVGTSATSSVTAHILNIRAEYAKLGTDEITSMNNAWGVIEWDADVHLLAKPELVLVINADGLVEQADGITVDGGQGVGYNVGPQFSVDNITNFYPGQIGFWISLYILDSAGNLHSIIRNSIPLSEPTITFEHQSPKITILNHSPSVMLVNGINNVDEPKPADMLKPLFTHTCFTAFCNDYMPAVVDVSEFGFFVQYVPVNTYIEIVNTHESGPDILLNPSVLPPPGADIWFGIGIDNPIGFTHIRNDHGDILSQGGVLRSDGFLLQAPLGNIGRLYGSHLDIEIVISDDGPSDPSMQIRSAVAGRDLNLALSGLLRTLDDTLPMEVFVDYLQAGGHVLLQLNEGTAQLNHPEVMHVIHEYATFQILGIIFYQTSGDICAHYPYEGYPCSSVNYLGLYGDGDTPIETSYLFGAVDETGILAGDSITVWIHAPSMPVTMIGILVVLRGGSPTLFTNGILSLNDLISFITWLAERLKLLLGDPDLDPTVRQLIQAALDELIGNNDGRAQNGVLDMLKKGNLNAAKVKLSKALQFLSEANFLAPELGLPFLIEKIQWMLGVIEA